MEDRDVSETGAVLLKAFGGRLRRKLALLTLARNELMPRELITSTSFAGGVGGLVPNSCLSLVSASGPPNMSPRSKLLVEASSSPKIKGGRNGGPISTEGKAGSVFER